MFAVTPDGTVYVVDETALRREHTARATADPDSLIAFIREHGTREAAARMHDAMFGPDAARDAPEGTPVAGVARAWKERR